MASGAVCRINFNSKMMHSQEDFDLVEKMVLDVFENKLNTDAALDVFIVDNPSHSKEYRNHVAHLIFEKCKAQTLNFMNSTTLALFSTGRTE